MIEPIEENKQNTIPLNLATETSSTIRSSIQDACQSTLHNAVVRLNSSIKEPVIGLSTEGPKAEDSSSIEALFRGELPFPLDALPENVRAVAQSLAVRWNIPVCVPATACMALASIMAGNRVKIDRGFGLPLGCNLYFVIGVDPNSRFRATIESILSPVLRLQDELIRQAQCPGSTGHRLPYMNVLNKWRRRQNRPRSAPLLLSSGMPSLSWEGLLETSWDGALFHSAWDGDMVLDLLRCAEKGKRHRAETVLKNAYAHEPFLIKPRREQEGTSMQEQSLGLLWLCDRDAVGRFASSRALVENGLSPCFIIFDSAAESAELTNAGVLDPTANVALEWERTIWELFYRRSRTEDEVWRLCEDGAAELAGFERFVRTRVPADYVMVPAWSERVWRMTLELHLLSGPTSHVIGADRAWNAVRLSAWYLGRQIRPLPRSAAASLSGELFKDRVLKKIRTKRAVSDLQLLRSFHRMSKAKLAPVVAELLRDGLVRRDENGKLVVAQ